MNSQKSLKINKNQKKINVERIEEIFEFSNPYMPENRNIIRDYVYIPQKRVI